MRMARVNITVPDDVVAQAKAAGLNVSRLATAALVEELDRRNKIAALLRTRTGRATTISATDAIVAALALAHPDPIVLTSDPDDLTALVAEQSRQVIIARADRTPLDGRRSARRLT